MNFRALLGLLLIGLAGFAPLSGAQVNVAVGQRQLFLDDYIIADARGFQRTMHSPEKRGAVIKPDIPADGSRIQTYGSVPMWSPEERIFKMVYMAFPMEDHSQIGAALAISKDGIHWEKPDLGQGMTVRGSSSNNRIFVDRDLRWGDNVLWNVIRDENDSDPNRRYKGLLGAEGRIPVVSKDCVQWTKLAGPKIPSHDTSTLTYDPQRRRYLAVVKTFNEYGRAAALSTSEDFQHWSAPRLCFSTDKTDQQMAHQVVRERIRDKRFTTPLFVDPAPGPDLKPPPGHIPTWRAECYAFSVFPYEGLFIGLPMIYYPTGQELPARNNTDGFDAIQLTMSRDLAEWKRLGDRKPFIGPSQIDQGLVGVFDRQQLLPPSSPLVMKDELWFYYTGFKTRLPMYAVQSDGKPRDPSTLTAAEQADLADGWSAICLAVLRRDGFISLDAKDKPATLLTKQFIANGTKLLVNTDATEGHCTVEALDGNGKVLAVSEPIVGDQLRAGVAWKSGDLTDLKGKVVCLRFTVRKAKLYSFWLDE